MITAAPSQPSTNRSTFLASGADRRDRVVIPAVGNALITGGSRSLCEQVAANSPTATSITCPWVEATADHARAAVMNKLEQAGITVDLLINHARVAHRARS